MYTRQKKRDVIRYGMDMNLFVKDILNIETVLGGDINIFKPFEINDLKNVELKKKIKKIFRNKKDKGNSYSSVGTRNTSEKISEQPIKVASSLNPLEIAIESDNFVSDKTRTIGKYKCYKDDSCLFITHRFELLKRHIQMHKIENKKDEDKKMMNTMKPHNNKRRISTHDNLMSSKMSQPRRKSKYEYIQQTAIVKDDNNSNSILQDISGTLDDTSEKPIVIHEGELIENEKETENWENSLCSSLITTINISKEGIQRSKEDKVLNEENVVEENDFTMGNNDQRKLQSIDSEPTLEQDDVCCIDLGTQPFALAGSMDKLNSEWNEFLHSIHDECNNQIKNLRYIRLL